MGTERGQDDSAVVLTFSYVPTILAHYRLILGGRRRGPRKNPEPPERRLTLTCGFCAFVVFEWLVLRSSGQPHHLSREVRLL